MGDSLLKEIRPDHVAIYIRWSTEEQAEGTTLVEQREGCEFYVKSQAWFVNPALIFIDDGYSGGNLDRPGMRQLRDLVQKGEVDCVVVLKIDRLSRNIVDATRLVLDEWKDKCHLRCVRQPIDTTSETGRMFFSILATFADFERAQITERTYQGRIRRLKEGKAYGGPVVPFGLLKGEEPGVRVEDPERAPIVREMFRRAYEERATAQDLAKWLTEQGIPSPQGRKAWSLNSVRNVLRNPIYAGRIVYGRASLVKKEGLKYPARQKRKTPTVVADAVSVPILVEPEVFEAVQLILEDRKDFHQKHRRASSSTHLLSGIATCRCGATMNIHWSRGVRHYICSRRILGGSDACPAYNGTVLAEKVEAYVVADLLEKYGQIRRNRKVGDILRPELSETAVRLSEEQGRLNAELRAVEQRLSELRAQAALGQISLTEWRELRTALEAKREGLQERLGEVGRLLERETSQDLREDTLAIRLDEVDRWDNLDPTERKATLRDLVEHIELYKPRGKNQPYHVRVVWRFNLGADVREQDA
ncbi:MAG: recombinase family protein [Bacillota bacterium]